MFIARALLVLASLIASLPISAAIRQSLQGDTLMFVTDHAVDSATLTVLHPDGESWKQSVKGGRQFSFDLRALGPDGLDDGAYLFELVLNDSKSSATLQHAVGGFSVRQGLIVNPGLPESTNLKDIELNEDVIAGDNLCVGLDCVVGMDFGFDALILRENNTRVLFDDTSNSSSFPNRDWRLIANDTSNGGANYFAIEDATAARQILRLGANAPASSLTVAPTGDIGIGTLTAQQDMHVVRGDSPTLRLDQNASGGYAPQVWDVGGNETQFYVRNGSAADAIPFRILPNAISGLLTVGDAVAPNRVTVDGEFYIGTDQVTPDYVFEPDYALMSIEAHHEAMLEQRHLPYIGAAQKNDDGRYVINVSQRSQGLLKELEIAHLYIAELHQRLEAMEQRLEALEQ